LLLLPKPPYQDVWKKVAFITLGLPGCSKSTWAAKNCPGLERLERDEIRVVLAHEAGEEFCWASWDFSREAEVTRRWQQRLDDLIRQGVGLVCSDTNLNALYRRQLAEKLLAAGYSLRYVFFDVPEEVCRRRNALRANPVQEEAYAKLLHGFKEARQILASEALELGIQLEVVDN